MIKKHSAKTFDNIEGNHTGLEARKVSGLLLGLVVDQGYSLQALCDGPKRNAAYCRLNARDQAMARAIITTTLRHRGAMLAVMKAVMDRPEPKRARYLTHILHTAAAQILFMQLPDSAAVNLGVAAISNHPSTQRFKGFANAVLRRVAREKQKLIEGVVCKATVMPQWLRERVRADFGKHNLDQMETMILQEPYLDISLKVGQSISDWADRLGAMALGTGSLRLTSNAPVRELEGYQQGAWWAQNAAAALPVRLLGNVSGLDVADLCAAPGGKSAQLASAGANVTLVDNSDVRLTRLTENFNRLQLKGDIVCANVLEWNPEKQFDHVFLDAPCSSTGTMRRHPDIMWAKKPEDITPLGELQRQLLQKAVELTKPGGTIIFATCSILKEEGEDIFAHAQKENNAVKCVPVVPEEVGGMTEIINTQGALRCLPCHLPLDPPRLGGLDGFFAGRLKKL